MLAKRRILRRGGPGGRGSLRPSFGMTTVLILSVLAGCTDPETYLPGPREALRDTVDLAPDTSDDVYMPSYTPETGRAKRPFLKIVK